MTVAFARIISDRIIPGEAWTGFERRIDDLLSRTSPILETYYSKDLLGSVRARDTFVEADVCELPTFRDTPLA